MVHHCYIAHLHSLPTVQAAITGPPTKSSTPVGHPRRQSTPVSTAVLAPVSPVATNVPTVPSFAAKWIKIVADTAATNTDTTECFGRYDDFLHVETSSRLDEHDIELKAIWKAIGKLETKNEKKWCNQTDFNDRYLINKRFDPVRDQHKNGPFATNAPSVPDFAAELVKAVAVAAATENDMKE